MFRKLTERLLLPPGGDQAHSPEPPLELVVPISHDWTTLGTGGGIETFLKLLFQYASDWNLRVTVPCTGPREEWAGSVHFLPIMRTASKEWTFTLRLRRELRRGTLKIERGSVVVANVEQYAWAFRGMRYPVVLVSHVAQPEQLRLRHTYLFVRLYQAFIERPAVIHARRIVVVNPRNKDYYLSRYPELRPGSLVFIPIGLDTEMLKGRPCGNPWDHLPLPRSADFVLFVGRLYPEKDIQLFIAACDLLQQPGSTLHAVVVGKGMQDGVVEDAVATRPWLHWIPNLSQHSDLLDLMAASSVLAVTSRYEGIPLVLTEAIGLGTPVVSTDVGMARELLRGRLGRVVDSTPSAFAEGIRDVLAWERADVKKAGQEATPRLDFRTTMDALSSVVRSVAQEVRP